MGTKGFAMTIDFPRQRELTITLIHRGVTFVFEPPLWSNPDGSHPWEARYDDWNPVEGTDIRTDTVETVTPKLHEWCENILRARLESARSELRWIEGVFTIPREDKP
jgi:hypothetical protein